MLYLLVPLVGFFILFVPAYYLLAPLFILRGQRYAARPELKVLDFDELSPGVEHFLRTRMEAVYDLGFGEPTLVQMHGAVPNVRAYLIMLVHREAGDKAMVSAVMSDDESRQTLYVEFHTRFATGEMVDTFNSPVLGAFPPGPTTIRTQTPSVTSPEELYELHQFVMQKHGLRGEKFVYPPGEAIHYLTENIFIEPFEAMVRRGWLAYDGRSHYHPTVKGAYLMTWGLMQPMTTIRHALVRRRERALLAEFDRA